MARDANSFLRLYKAPGAVDNYFVSAVTGRECLSEPFLFTLTVRSQGDIPPVEEWIGASITFGMGASDSVLRKINGQCVRFEQSYHKGSYVEYVMDLAPEFARTKQRRDCRIFTDKTAIDIIELILDEHQMSYDASSVNFVDDVREYCVQYWESDFEFCSRLMEEEGIFYFFKYDEDSGLFDHMMYLADDNAAYFDGDIFEINFFENSHNQGLVDIDLQHMQTTSAWLSHDYNYKSPESLTPINTPTKVDYSAKNTRFYEWPGGYNNATSGSRRSRFGIELEESRSVIMSGEGTYMCFLPAARFEITDKRLKPGERNIAVRSVNHTCHNPFNVSEGEFEYKQTFTAVPSQEPYHPPRVTPKALVRGPQTAIVLNETDPEGFGRVMVRFHWDHGGTSTCWLRVAQQWAGPDMGAQWIPRIGWEVLVVFLEGDPDRPVVSSALYNGDNHLPFTVPQNLSQSGWRTRSYPKGQVKQEFIFEDKSGGEEIYTFAGRNYRREVINNEDVTIGNNLKSSIGVDESREVGENRSTRIGKDESYEIDGSRSAKIKKDESFDIKGARSAKIEKDESIDIGGARTLKVTGDEKVDISGNEDVSISQKLTYKVDGGVSLDLSGEVKIDDKGGIEIKTDGKFNLTSKEEIVLSVAGNVIEIKGEGITINGSLVRIN